LPCDSPRPTADIFHAPLDTHVRCVNLYLALHFWFWSASGGWISAQNSVISSEPAFAKADFVVGSIAATVFKL
jgi:hypothetical protein